MSATVRKFLFDHDFDDARPAKKPDPTPQAAAPPPPPPPAAPPPPTFSAADLAKARTQGYQEGEKAGRAAGIQAGKGEAEAQFNRQMQQALQKLADGVHALMVDRQDLEAARTRDPLLITLAIVRRLWPELVRRHGLDEIEALVASCLGDLTDEPKLMVRVHASVLDPVRERVETLARERGFEGRLVIAGHDRIPPGNCHVEWATGGALRDIEAALAQIEAIAGQLLTATAGPA